MAINEQAKVELGFANALRDCLVCGIILIDNRQTILSCSPEACQFLGLDTNLAPPTELDALPAPLPGIIRRLLASGAPIAARRLEMNVDGRTVTLRLNAVPLPSNPATGGGGMVVVLNDLASAKRLEQNMWRLDRLASIGTLSASMAHEIKNALVAGRTFIDLLLEKHQDSELVEIVRREMARIDSIVSRMLKFVGPPRQAFAPLHLHESLDHSLRLVQPQLEAKAISISRQFQAEPDLLNGDDYELQQAFVNIFLNALEAMKPSGSLTVVTERVPSDTTHFGLRETAEASRLRVTIEDTGAGINAADMARLFEPFFTTKPSGTGLGLPITQRIIQEHRGSITAESQPGKGTAFRILFPALIKKS
jgi:two-component system sensor histidine kinase HydH